MTSNFSRGLTALALTASLLAGSASALAAGQDKTAAGAKASDQKDAQAKKDAQKSAPAVVQASANRTLSENEDPRLIGKRKINKGTVFSSGGSLEKEVALGRQLSAEVDRQAKFVDDPTVTEYVNRVGQNLVLHSDAKIPFTIKVIDSDEVNAFALPGGFFYVNKGLLLAADNEAELAGVMAHEIAHVASRHAMENMRKGQWLEGLAMVGSIFLGGIPGMIYQSTAGLGLAAAFFKFTRGAEEEADRLGVQYLWAAGYDPSAMSTMFEKLNAQNKKKPGFFARTFTTHPQPPDRVEATRVLVARFPDREEYVISTSEFQRVKNRLLRLSNSRVSSTGDLAAGDDGGGAPGRPTLKRRQPTADEAGPVTDATREEPKNEAPRLKRRTGDPATTTTPAPTQPGNNP
jgi:predicted Zn-dependent protease